MGPHALKQRFAVLILLFVGSLGIIAFVAERVFENSSLTRFVSFFQVSPMPHPFENLPRNTGFLGPYGMEICTLTECRAENYLTMLNELDGPHRYRVSFYQAPIYDPINNPLVKQMLINIVCHSKLFQVQRSLGAPIHHFTLSQHRYECI